MFTNISLAPLFFVRSGFAGHGGYFVDLGINGCNWSSRIDGNEGVQTAYYVAFGDTGTYPSLNGNFHVDGFPLRCLVVGKV